MKKIIIRADSNEIIAGGHIMRTKSVAYALKEQGAEVIFVTSDEKSKPLLADFENVVLGTKYDDMESEIPKFQALIKEIKPSIILIDSYFVTPKYFKALKNLAKIAYIDDLNAFCYEVDLLINYSAFLKHEFYKNKQNLAKKLLLGASFAPLRAEFYKSAKSEISSIKKVLLTTGNTDNLGFCPKLLEKIILDEFFKELEFCVICGHFNIYKDALKTLSQKHKNIKVLENVENMAQIMLSCDAAISAGGSTLYELCALKIPTICLKIAANQMGTVLWGREAMIYAGDANSDINAVLDNTILALNSLISNPQKANELANIAHNITDGKGAKRIAEQILENSLFEFSKI